MGQRLRELRESKNLSQGDLEKRTGLLRRYISRVENGHTAPNIETLEKCANALEIPTYKLFYEGDGPPPKPKWTATVAPTWGMTPTERRELKKFSMALSRMDDRQRRLLFAIAGFMARPNRRAF